MTSIIINYCSNEHIFIDPILNQCKIFSNDIVVSYGSHLYNGTIEDEYHIEDCKKKHPEVQFVKYDVDFTLDLKKQRGVIERPKAYWHNLARWTAVSALKKKQWVFVLDADEIPEGEQVKLWLELFLDRLKKNECYKNANYWYFKDVTNQATTLEDSVLLIHHDHLSEKNIFGDNERDHLIYASKTTLIRQIKGLDNKPMWHHYSFVREKKGLVHKLTNWGHSGDIFKSINAQNFVDYVYKDNEVNDIVHGYSYAKVNNIFDIKFISS